MEAVDPKEYYEDGYFAEKGRPYRDRSGNPATYYGPARVWEGYEYVLDGLIPLLCPRPESVLDLGCGAGDFVRRCCAHGVRAWGIDISREALARPAAPEIAPMLVHGDVAEVGTLFPDGAELVTALDLLEHLYYDDLGGILETFRRVTKRYFFTCVCTAVGTEMWTAEKGKPIPVDREWQAVSGHVSNLSWEWWVDVLSRHMQLAPMWEEMYRLQVYFSEHPEMRKVLSWGPRFVYLGRKL